MPIQSLPAADLVQPRPIRVLVVDDSSLARKVILSCLEPFSGIQVIETAIDPYDARDKILSLNPDVVTLDIEMPRMDGLTFLRAIMKHRPMPVIVMSTLTAAGSAKALEALQAGALEVMEKPRGASPAHGAALARRIIAAAGARVKSPLSGNPTTIRAACRRLGDQLLPGATGPAHSGVSRFPARAFDPRQIILLGASTGGTEALKTMLTGMSANVPGICIVQHIPGYFSRAFAERLDQTCAVRVREAVAGDTVEPGVALVAPGGFHMLLKWRGRYVVELTEGPPIHHQRPAVDILFESAVRAGAGSHAVAALLTGMGADGASGLLQLRQAGAKTIAQDEASCVVFGMPREAIRLGAAQHVLSLEKIGPCLEQWSGG